MMYGRERKRDRFKRLVFGNQTASSATSLQAEATSAPCDQQTDPISLDPPTLDTSRRPVSPNQEVPLSTLASGELESAGLPSSCPVEVQNPLMRDFWTAALEKLSEKDKLAIQKLWSPLPTDSRSTGGLPQQLVALVETKREECERNNWKFMICGRQIILRDVAEKVITWLNKFKEIGDIAVNFDPVHAALPWAGVRFLLQTVVAESEQMGALLVGMDTVTNFINRCSIYEVLYLNDGQVGQACSNLELALVKLYAVMLQFLASANVLYDSNAGGRVIRALLEPTKVTTFVANCGKLQAQVDVEANNCESTNSGVARAKIDELGKLLVDLTTPILRTDLKVAKLWDRLEDSRRNKILTWTSSIPYEDNHYTARQGHVGGTGKWLLEHERYREWRGSSASMILWLHGIPGAGKTKLVSTVVDTLRSAIQNTQNDEALAYFYCDRNQSDRRNPILILSSFVRQLSTSRNWDAIQPSLVGLYTEKEKTGFASKEMSIEESEKVLLELTNIYPQTTLVLDALDESDKRTRGQLIEVLDGLLEQSSKPIKIFISSRPDQDIRDRFDNGPNLGIRAVDNHGDISTFVDSKIEKSPEKWRKRISTKLRREIRNTLVEKSNGM